MQRIGIVGGGFSGTMLGVQLIRQIEVPIEIVLFYEGDLNRGQAFGAYSDTHLLNVASGKMSAFPDSPGHFVDWLISSQYTANNNRELIEGSFLPRFQYGSYLEDVWREATQLAKQKNISIQAIPSKVVDLSPKDSGWRVLLENEQHWDLTHCVLATGNQLPRNPIQVDSNVLQHPGYHQNPWQKESVAGCEKETDTIIIGNGLTMVDAALGLIENGFTGTIHSISPNGFHILPHRHGSIKYQPLLEELGEDFSLQALLALINRHRKVLGAFGISPEPLVDALRPHTQRIWMALSSRDKQRFLSRLRHHWGVARHRLPQRSYDVIQQLRIDRKLQIHAGRIQRIELHGEAFKTTFLVKGAKDPKELWAPRIINCTGPETDISRLPGSFLFQCLKGGWITQDELKLGVAANPNTFAALDAEGRPHPNLFIIGPLLRGTLWESTAVNELRSQCQSLAHALSRSLVTPV